MSKRKIISKKRVKIKIKPHIKKQHKRNKVIPIPVSSGRKRKAKTSSKMYFTQSTEDAIVEYNNTTDMELRERIYRDKIEFPLKKLVENVFNRFGFTYFETSPHDVQREALAHLVANLGKYDRNRPNKKKVKGKQKKNKAFSYFSVIAKNWFILLNNNNYKKFQTHVEISEEKGENTVQLQHTDKHHTQTETDEFMNLTIKFWESNVNKIFNKQRDLDIANAVIELLRNSQRIDAFNKKALYLYIRDISDCKTQQITKVLNRMKQYHKLNYRAYLNYGTLSPNSNGDI